MADAKKYHVDTARDDIGKLNEVLQGIAARNGHVRIVSVIWRSGMHGEGYTIISETEI